ncbi:hypothetical protein PQR15_32150 [Streptomyces lydicus]|nr:hypothetical protein [Streptomyces lydicus]
MGSPLRAGQGAEAGPPGRFGPDADEDEGEPVDVLFPALRDASPPPRCASATAH